MALAIKIGDTYNTGLLVNAPVVDIDITDLIGTSITITNEHETEVEVEEGDTKTFKLHKIEISNEVAESLFTDFDSIPTFTTYPDYEPSFWICKEWNSEWYPPTISPDYSIPACATKIYAGTEGRDDNASSHWFLPSDTPLYPPAAYDNEEEYLNDWDSSFDAENWKWKYCYLVLKPIEQQVGQLIQTNGRWYGLPRSFDYDATTDPRESPYDYENPYPTNIYRLTPEWQMYRIIYPSEYTRFGISHFWRAEDAGGGKYEIYNTARLFANPTNVAVNSLENFLPRVKDKNGDWITLGANMYTEVYGPADTPEYASDTYPTETVPYLNKFFFVHYTYDDEEYYAIMVCNVYSAETKSIWIISGWGISENFYTMGVEPTPDPEDSEEEPGDGGVRPPLINQTATSGLMGLNFDLGLGHADPSKRGLKLTYMPLSVLNSYIETYIEDKTGALPDYDKLPAPDKLLFAPTTEAIVQNCYDTFLDVYKLPVAPDNGSGFTSFNIAGKVIDGSEFGGGGQTGFSQRKELDLGVVNLHEIFGSYLDYAPNIKAYIWLPFCGMFEIPINAFMGGGLELKYIIDLLSGSCTAYVFGIDRHNHSTLIGSFGGDMKLPVPLAAVAANTGIIGQALRNGLNSFASSQISLSNVAKHNVQLGDKVRRDVSQGNLTGMINTGLDVSKGIEDFFKQGAGTGSDIAQFVSEMREAEPTLSAVIGQVGGIGGWCGWNQPYVRLVCPVRGNPTGYTDFLGRPANVNKKIRDLSTGTLNRANAPRITIPHATQQEKDAIYRILTTGFYK